MIGIEIEPDVMTPDQWAGDDAFSDLPERRLLLAMLEEAFSVLKYQTPSGRAAYRWLMSEAESWGTFVFVCDLCGLDRWKLRRHGKLIWVGRIRYARPHHRVVRLTGRIADER